MSSLYLLAGLVGNRDPRYVKYSQLHMGNYRFSYFLELPTRNYGATGN